MSSKPESTFIASVHRKLPKGASGPHAEKMHNAYRGGTADCYYSGKLGDMWIEFKFLTKIPLKALISPDLSGLQRDWLGSRHAEGRNVAVIVGCPEGGVLYRSPPKWLAPMSPEDFRELVVSREELADFILKQVGARCDSSEASSQQQPPSVAPIRSSRRRS